MRVFISHTVRDRRDRGLARDLAAGLGARGVEHFIAPDSIPAGAEWEPHLIDELMSRCSIFLVIVSAASLDPDGYVVKEIDFARQRRASGSALRILQIVVGDLETPFPDLQVVPYHDDRLEQVEAVLKELGFPPSTPLDRVFDPLSLRGTRRLTAGAFVAKLCDRKPQERQFQTAFRTAVTGGTRLPQLYVVRGWRREAHDSLVERLAAFFVHRYAVHAGGAGATIVRIRVDWPANLVRSLMKDALLSELFAALDGTYGDGGASLTPEEWVRRTSAGGDTAIVIEHELPSTGWGRDDTRTLDEYLAFWRAVGAAAPAVHCIVFFKAVYDVRDSWLERWALRRATEKIGRAASAGALHATLLDELQCIRQVDVDEWFDERAADYDLARREQHCRALFASEACRRMSDVEARLFAVQREMLSGGNA